MHTTDYAALFGIEITPAYQRGKGCSRPAKRAVYKLLKHSFSNPNVKRVRLEPALDKHVEVCTRRCWLISAFS